MSGWLARDETRDLVKTFQEILRAPAPSGCFSPGVKLPVHEVEEEIRAAVRNEKARILLKAPTGSGKSTTVPVMVRGEVEGRVLVVQPRRMAARLLANFVARQLGTFPGKGVGYAVRFESRMSESTGILFVTDGVFQRMLVDNPELTGVGAVIFDEFHERRLSSDLSIGRVLDLQEKARPDLRVVVMSATLETGGLREYLNPCDSIETGGRLFPVEIEHRGNPVTSRRGLNRKEEIWDRILALVKQEIRLLSAGDRILVFLPGSYEIKRTQRLLEQSRALAGWEVRPLTSGLKPEVQEAAICQDESKRIILATNVAETSLTIEGVRVVVDSGLARQASFDVGRGFDSLRVGKISQAAAKQRAGRAGRTGPGRCVRLWSENDHRARPEFEIPEVMRVDLAEAVLFLNRLGVIEVEKFRWLDLPEKERVSHAIDLLANLGAIDEGGGLTAFGKEMAALPMHPRLSALVLNGRECAGEVLFIAAAVQGEGLFKKGGKEPMWREFLDGEPGWPNDFSGEWLALLAAQRVDFRPRDCDSLGVLARGARETWQTYGRLVRMMQERGWKVKEPDFRQRGEACARAVLSAFGDCLAVRRDCGSVVCEVVGGRRGKLHPKSVVRDSGLFLATDLIEVEGRETGVILSRCLEIDESWLEGELIQERESVVFDEVTRRVVAVKERVCHGLVLEQKKGGNVDPDLAGSLLAQRVLAGELSLKKWDSKVERWIARLAFLSDVMPELELPGFDESDRETVITEMCAGATTFKEVRDRDPWKVLREWLSPPQKEALDAYAPEKITLVNGISTRVRYQAGSDPWIEEKVQRLYGVDETPQIASDYALLVKVLAPNQRPWQMTKDLPGFWERGFAQMKKDLAGRYPKHNWEGGFGR